MTDPAPDQTTPDPVGADVDAKDLAEASEPPRPLADADLRAAVMHALTAELAGGVQPSTAGRLVSVVAILTDTDTALLLLNFLARAWDDDTLLGELEQTGAGREFVLWIREVLSIHGRDIRRAQMVDGQSPDGWLDFKREVYFDEVEGRWMYRLIITKIDGSVIELADEVVNMLVLAQIVMSGCALVPAQVRAVDPLANRIEQVIASAEDLAAEPLAADDASLAGGVLGAHLAGTEPPAGAPPGEGSVADGSSG